MWVHALVCVLFAGAAVCYGEETTSTRSLFLEHPSLPNHDAYYTVEQIDDFLMAFEATFNLTFARVGKMKLKTYENRSMHYLEIGTKSGFKPVIFIEALTHARDWISGAAVLAAIHGMLTGNRREEKEYVRALRDFTWIFLPVSNPDGYAYSMTPGNRNWQKNRHYFREGCIGINLGKNYNCTVRTWLDCAGENAFPEPETQNIMDLFKESYIAAFVSVGAFGQTLSLPRGTAHFKRIKTVAREMVEGMKDYRTFPEYAGMGEAYKWAQKEKPGIYSYRFDLRPRSPSEGGYALDATQIKATGEEFMHSLLRMSQGMVREKYPVQS